MSEEKVAIPIDDSIWGIEGSYAGKEKASGYDSEEDLYYIKYVPDTDPNRSFPTYLKLFAGQPPVCKTPEPIPDSAFEIETCDDVGTTPGVPERKLVMRYDRHGDARWAEKKGRSAEKRLKRAKEKQKSEQSRSLTQKAKSMRLQQEQDMEDDSRRRPRHRMLPDDEEVRDDEY
ncbi:hypothetical protein [Halomontanus rarus]|uniref:hypothetical protein n=1 Tax=Halomontanus rarus TaxID=3034020 RepID=UPI001A990549